MSAKQEQLSKTDGDSNSHNQTQRTVKGNPQPVNNNMDLRDPIKKIDSIENPKTGQKKRIDEGVSLSTT